MDGVVSSCHGFGEKRPNHPPLLLMLDYQRRVVKVPRGQEEGGRLCSM